MIRILTATTLIAAAICPGCAPEDRPARRPNVLIVVLDTTRADILSSYGCEAPTTPSIDAVAAQGTRYTRAYSTDFWTLPGHGSLFSGLYPSEARTTSETKHVPDETLMLAEMLSAAGYRTRAASSNPWIGVQSGFGQGFEEFFEAWRATPGREPGPPDETPLRWIREFAETGQPFFMFLNYNTPHLPYEPPPAVRERFVGAHRPAARVRQLATVRGGLAHFTGNRSYTAEDFAILRELYAAEVNIADELVGQVIAELESTGLLDETLVIITSDHGENLGDHDLTGHMLSMHESTLRVPLIVRYPPRFAAGLVRDELISLIDVVPTVLDVTGLATDENRTYLERHSLAGATREAREFVIAENDRPLTTVEVLRTNFPDFDAASIDHRMRVIREERYKLIWRIGVGVELYDLQNDPGETDDLAGRLPEVEARLRQRLDAWMASLRTGDPAERFDTTDPETLERLRSLGYLE